MSERDRRARLKEKLTQTEVSVLEGDQEFCFALGQLWYYLVYQSQAANKNYSLLSPVLATKRLDRIKQLTLDMINSYSHALTVRNPKLNRLIALVSAYENENFINAREWTVAGFAMDNLILEKGDKKDDQ